jgi:hypothetical protein
MVWNYAMSPSRRRLTPVERASIVELTGVSFPNGPEEVASEETASVYSQSSISRYSQLSEKGGSIAPDADDIDSDQPSILGELYGDYFADESSLRNREETSRVAEWTESVYNSTRADFGALEGTNLDGEPSRSRWSLDSADRPPPQTRWSFDGDDFTSFAEKWSSGKKSTKRNFRKYVTNSNGIIDLAAAAKLSQAIGELLPKFNKNLSGALRDIASNFGGATKKDYMRIVDIVYHYGTILENFRNLALGSEEVYQDFDKILSEIRRACVRSQENAT